LPCFIKLLNKQQKMKKSLLSVAIAGLMLVVACGPSAEEIAAEKKRVDDSIAAVRAAEEAEAKRIADEAAAAAAAEEARLAAEAEAAAKAAEAEAAAKAKKTTTSKPKETKPAEVKAGQGKM
jgi:hypothetical protein